MTTPTLINDALMPCPVCARLSELLACSRGGSTHYAVEPEISSVDVQFDKRNDAGEMGSILSKLHPVDGEGCYVFNRPLPPPRTPTAGEPSVADVERVVSVLALEMRRPEMSGEPFNLRTMATNLLEAITTMQSGGGA